MAVTMSRIAADTGIGRATLYKYFPDVEAVLAAWHERHVSTHVAELLALRDRPGPVSERLRAVLEACAGIAARRDGSGISLLLHGDGYVAEAEIRLLDLVRDLLREGADAGEVRADLSADELAQFCLHAVEGARALPSKASVHRLVAVTMDALRTPAP